MPAFQGIPLLPGDRALFAADFTQSPLLRNHKAGLVVTADRVAVLHPQFVFIFFQVGQTVSSSPIGAISEVTVGRLLSRSRLRSAILAILVAVFLMISGSIYVGPLSILLVLIALAFAGLQLWLARHLGMTIQHSGGGSLSLAADAAEHQQLLASADLVQQLVIGRKPTSHRS